ncbi:hypothetical protein CEXT_631611 [Caerostris extrusa]|uniref:Uncharacterized protein n=1 Tax=Caerostris extrusa TaxID=172846 RepID=A0AAV4XKR8_CAEEX|nr:hypothetical protein CEXT_631611 [Caerostris extrusa]
MKDDVESLLCLIYFLRYQENETKIKGEIYKRRRNDKRTDASFLLCYVIFFCSKMERREEFDWKDQVYWWKRNSYNDVSGIWEMA